MVARLLRIAVFICAAAAAVAGAWWGWRQWFAEDMLREAIARDDETRVKWLIRLGAPVNTVLTCNLPGGYILEDGRTLHWAVLYDHRDVAGLLLARGADVNGACQGGWSSLHLAAWFHNRKAAAFLLDNGADVNLKDEVGCTPLDLAATCDSTDVAELLLAHNADVNTRDNNNSTPLHKTAWHGQKKTGEFLLAHGADPDARDDFGITPRDLWQDVWQDPWEYLGTQNAARSQ